jgi:C4-dicarboxylate-specific signal transduction histidine kinase
VRILPYRTLENMIDGVVITIGDITVSKTLEAELRKSQAELETRIVAQRVKLDQTEERLRAETERGHKENGDEAIRESDEIVETSHGKRPG